MHFELTALKLITGFIILLIYIKISGRGQLAPLTASDQVGNMVIGALVGSTVISTSISVSEAVIVVSMWAALLLLVRFLKFRSPFFTRILDGKRVQLIRNGQILPDNFVTARLTMLDFTTILRQQDVKTLREVRNAWLEPNGQISLDRYGDPNQLILLAANGSIVSESLAQIGKDEEWLMAELAGQGAMDISDVLYAEWYQNKLSVYLYNGNGRLKNETGEHS